MARDLSPYSARKLLTQKIATGDTVQSDSGSPCRERSSRNGSDGGRQNAPIPSRPRQRSRSREGKQATPSKADNLSNKPQGAETERNRAYSPEPYRKPRESSKERKHSRSRDRRRNRSSDRRRDRSRHREDDDRREGRRNRSSDRRRDDTTRDRDTDTRRRRHGSEDYKRRERSRSRDRRQKEKAKHSRRARSRSRSPTVPRSRKQRTRSASSSASPPPKRRRRSRSRSHSKSPPRRAKQPLPSQEVSFRGLDDSVQSPSKYGGAPVNKEKPNFKTTGALAKHANRVEGTKISLKYHEPAEARKPPPSQPWRIFVFKGDDVVDTIEIWQKSCWLLGRAHEVVDYVLEHPSSSGQHAVIQFRYIQKTIEDEFGVKSKKGKVKPYVIDLESSNGTELNGEAVEASRYFELRDKDIIKFAGSEREYVIMLPPPDGK